MARGVAAVAQCDQIRRFIRAPCGTRNQVVKQDGSVALTYTPLRMMKCRES